MKIGHAREEVQIYDHNPIIRLKKQIKQISLVGHIVKAKLTIL